MAKGVEGCQMNETPSIESLVTVNKAANEVVEMWKCGAVEQRADRDVRTLSGVGAM